MRHLAILVDEFLYAGTSELVNSYLTVKVHLPANLLRLLVVRLTSVLSTY